MVKEWRVERRARAGVAALAMVSLVLVSAAAALAAPTQSRRPAATLRSLERGVLADINAVRTQHHLVPLRLSSPLTTAALVHTRQMAAGGYFAHESPDGSAFSQRIQQFYSSGPWSYWSVGENLLWSTHVDAQQALELWLSSPEHRANLLRPRWREIGVAALRVSGAPGAFHGLDVTIMTTDFGVRH